jgi:hypothetical protein
MKRRTRAQQQRAAAKRHRINNPGQKSKYARKAAWLFRHGVWGFEVPFPKPWKLN